MHFLYILHSKSLNRFYIGETSDLNQRLEFHQQKINPKSFTAKANDWLLKLSYPCNTKEDALFLERFIKRMKSKSFILEILQSPEFLDDILKKNV